MKKGQTEPSLFQRRDPVKRKKQLANMKQHWSNKERAARNRTVCVLIILNSLILTLNDMKENARNAVPCILTVGELIGKPCPQCKTGTIERIDTGMIT